MANSINEWYNPIHAKMAKQWVILIFTDAPAAVVDTSELIEENWLWWVWNKHLARNVCNCWKNHIWAFFILNIPKIRNSI